VPQPGWPLRDILREVAGGMRCLLLVDNCEHAVAETAEIIADLLTTGSQLRVLATSREPLGVPGEATFPVRTLPVPSPRDSARIALRFAKRQEPFDHSGGGRIHSLLQLSVLRSCES
jgi:predicted ATPase